MKLTGAAILFSRGMKVLQAAPAAYPYRSPLRAYPMAWFRCFIRGENFPGELIGDPGLIGFYTNRFVEADSPEDAESLAIQQLRTEGKLQPPPAYAPTGIAKVFFQEIMEVAADEVPEQVQGFAFYSMVTDDAE